MRKHNSPVRLSTMLTRRNGSSFRGSLEEKLFHACSRGDIKSVKYYLEQGANMNMICSAGRTPFGTAAQLGNIAVLKVFLDHCKDKNQSVKVNSSLNEIKSKKSESKDKKETNLDKSNLGNLVFVSKGQVGSASGEADLKVDENLNSQYQKVYCSCNEMDDVCLGKSCEHCKSFMSTLNKTSYELACFNDTFVRLDPRFKSKKYVNEFDLLSDDEVRTPDGMDGLEWDMEIEGSSDVTGDDPCSALYIWYAGILSQTSALLEEKPPPKDIDREDQFGRRALHYAAVEGHIDAVRLLINAGCKINVVDLGNLTPLHMAAAKDVAEVMEALIAAGANVHHKTIDKISPLHVSASRGILNNVRLLVEAGAHVDTLDASDRSPLFMAVSRCHNEVVAYLLSKGAKVNIEEIHGYTPLYEAVLQKNTAIVKMLLKAGAKITQSHHLLQYAILHRHEEMVRLLISAGSVINLRDYGGDTPLILAAKTRQPNIARLLLENGAEINYTNFFSGTTALQEAISNIRGGVETFEEMFKVFQEYDVDLEFESGFGCPALYKAVIGNQDEAAAILIRHGANVNLVLENTQFMFPHRPPHMFQRVLQRGNQLLVQLFVYAGYDFRKVHVPKTGTHPVDRWLSHMQANPMRLCDLCRIMVRRQFKSKVYKKVEELPVPPAIKTFLKLEDVA